MQMSLLLFFLCFESANALRLPVLKSKEALQHEESQPTGTLLQHEELQAGPGPCTGRCNNIRNDDGSTVEKNTLYCYAVADCLEIDGGSACPTYRCQGTVGGGAIISASPSPPPPPSPPAPAFPPSPPSRQGASRPGAGGDPRVTNLEGSKFEILQVGTFSFLHITKEEAPDTALLALNARIARVSNRCTAAYIQDMSLTGSWISEVSNASRIDFRAVNRKEKRDSFEINVGGEWENARKFSKTKGSILKKVTKSWQNTTEVSVDTHGVILKVFNDRHVSTHADFLNLNVEGLLLAEKSGLKIDGLLGRSDYEFATKPDNDCVNIFEKSRSFADENLFLSTAHVLV